MSQPACPSRAAGFTLLEMLVALMVFGLLMAGLSQTMRYGLTAWSSETRASAGPEQLAAVDNALRGLIERTLPTGFTGRPASFACTTTLPAGAGLADRLADIALVVAPGQHLILRWTPHPAGLPLTPPPPPQIEPLLDQVAAIHVSYLMPQPSGPASWSDHWTSNGLPLLVRISIAFADRRSWPDLVAAPIASAP
jgi:general secretion pathway protein J